MTDDQVVNRVLQRLQRSSRGTRLLRYTAIGHLYMQLDTIELMEVVQRCVACSTIGPHDSDLCHQKASLANIWMKRLFSKV
jgi:hypothetical protein